ncbi:hypothetical protein AB7M49_007825 [Bradyrhizobium elkanii]
MRNLAKGIEYKHDPNPLAFIAQIIQHHPVILRRDLLEPEGVRGHRRQLRPPIIRQRGTAADPTALAGTLEPSLIGIKVEQRLEVVAPAAVEPIHHSSHFVKLVKSNLASINCLLGFTSSKTASAD